MFVDIKNYEGIYKINKNGKVLSVKQNKILKGKIGIKGYVEISLSKEGKRKYTTLHRLLAETFIKNEHNKKCVNHKDGNKLNNSLDNLEWCTYSENIKHAFDTGLKKPRRNGLTYEQHHKVKVKHIESGKTFNSIKECAEYFKIRSGVVCNHCKDRIQLKNKKFIYI